MGIENDEKKIKLDPSTYVIFFDSHKNHNITFESQTRLHIEKK